MIHLNWDKEELPMSLRAKSFDDKTSRGYLFVFVLCQDSRPDDYLVYCRQ